MRCDFMHVSDDDAAVIYARACRSWYGKKALHIVTNKIREQKRAGDVGGVKAWSQVATKLEDSEDSQKKNVPLRFNGYQNGKLY
jgi:hypothetical protein